MSTLAEIENVIPQLTVAELNELERFIRQAKQEKASRLTRSALDLKPLDLGATLGPLGTREEWYDEMTEGRM